MTLGKITSEHIDAWHKEKGLSKKFSLKAIRKDITFIEGYEGREMVEHRNPTTGALEWIDNSRKHGGTRHERRRIQETEKKKIGALATALITGFGLFAFDRKKTDEVPELKDIRIGMLDDVLKQADGADLRLKLKAFWRDGQRTIFVDAGTTMQTLAERYLQHLEIPLDGASFQFTEEESAEEKKAQEGKTTGGQSDHKNAAAEEAKLDASEKEATRAGRSVNKIEVITNDRLIFNCLGDAKVQIKTIMIGGRQQFRSNSVAGLMAENFLKANDIRAGMAIVSATGIYFNFEKKKAFFYAENEHFASMKRQFLDRSTIRIIVADYSKFSDQERVTDVRICNVENNGIDLVLTDRVDAEVKTFFNKLGVPIVAYDSLPKDSQLDPKSALE